MIRYTDPESGAQHGCNSITYRYAARNPSNLGQTCFRRCVGVASIVNLPNLQAFQTCQ